jgi:hypothetical protein
MILYSYEEGGLQIEGYTGVDAFKVTQTLPVCKGRKTGQASGTEGQERGKADTDCDETESEHTTPTATLPGKPAEQWAKKSTCVVPQHVERGSAPPGSIGVITYKCGGNCLSCKQATAELYWLLRAPVHKLAVCISAVFLFSPFYLVKYMELLAKLSPTVSVFVGLHENALRTGQKRVGASHPAMLFCPQEDSGSYNAKWHCVTMRRSIVYGGIGFHFDRCLQSTRHQSIPATPLHG